MKMTQDEQITRLVKMVAHTLSFVSDGELEKLKVMLFQKEHEAEESGCVDLPSVCAILGLLIAEREKEQAHKN